MSESVPLNVLREDRVAVVADSRPKEEAAARRAPRDVDGRWAWVVLGASFVAAVIINGQIYNSGIYFSVFLREFGESRATTSWIVASQGMCLCVAGPASSLSLARFGTRRTMVAGAVTTSAALAATYFADSIVYLVVTFGLCGIGGCLVITGTIAAVADYFRRYLYPATGLTLSGVGVGITVVGLELEWTVATFGWRGSMLVHAGTVLQIVVCAALVFRLPVDARPAAATSSSENNEKKRRSVSKKVLLDARFLLVLVIFFVFYGLLVVLMGLLKEAVTSHDFRTPYPTVVAGFGACNTLGRFASGLVAVRFDPPLQFCASSALSALAAGALVCVRLEWLYVACVFLLGFGNGQQVVLLNLMLSHFFGRETMAQLFGYGIFLAAFSVLGMSPLLGFLIDVSGNYDAALGFLAAGFFLCGVLAFVALTVHRRKKAAFTERYGPNGRP